MGKSTGKGAAVVVDSQGRELSLGALLELLVSRSDLPITKIAEAAGVSRSFFYLLRDDKQIPSLESLVSLLAACESGEVRLAELGEPGEVVVTTGGETYYVHLSSTRSRFASSTLRSTKPASSWSSEEDIWPHLAPPDLPRSPTASDSWGLATWSPAYADPAPPSPSAPTSDGRRRFTRAREGGRDRLLGDLLEVAGGLDQERLDLLVEYARLLRRS